MLTRPPSLFGCVIYWHQWCVLHSRETVLQTWRTSVIYKLCFTVVTVFGFDTFYKKIPFKSPLLLVKLLYCQYSCVKKEIFHFHSISFVQIFCSLSCSQNKALVHLENIRRCAWTGDPALLGTNHQRQRGVLSIFPWTAEQRETAEESQVQHPADHPDK